jgi:hypothetical protein
MEGEDGIFRFEVEDEGERVWIVSRGAAEELHA